MAGYWDGPEGEECPRRTWLTTRVGAAAGKERGDRGSEAGPGGELRRGWAGGAGQGGPGPVAVPSGASRCSGSGPAVLLQGGPGGSRPAAHPARSVLQAWSGRPTASSCSGPALRSPPCRWQPPTAPRWVRGCALQPGLGSGRARSPGGLWLSASTSTYLKAV